ncbi:SDR family oxidoreductase [Rhabdobacter roseus]
MKTIVITGSSRGIGRGLAEAFLKRGCRVCISSRSAASVGPATELLQGTFGSTSVTGVVADVTQYADLLALREHALSTFGRIDIWINNAGLSHPARPLWQLDAATLEAVADTNLKGTLLGSRVALEYLVAQGHGQLYNLLGLGSNGMKVPGFALYGSTKYALKYLTDGLIREVKSTPVRVGSISPGMVVTDLLTGDYDKTSAAWAKTRKIVNILADKVETVSPWLVDQILNDHTNGSHIAWLTKGKIVSRFALAPFRTRHMLE